MVFHFILEIPPITRCIVISSVLLSYATYTQYLSPANLYLNSRLAFTDQFQPWRALTSMLYFGDLDLFILFRLFFLQSISSSLESHTFRGIGHYSYYLLFNFIALLITGLWLNEHSLSESFVVALMYLWSRLNQERPLQFMFVIPIKAQYITWFFIFLNIIFGRSIKSNLIGALVGHTYYYFAHIVPKLPHFKGINISINQSNCINRLSEQVKSVYNFYFVNFANYLQLLFINRMRKFRKEQNIVLREEPNEPREANDLLF